MSISKNKIGVLINMDKNLKHQLEEFAKQDNRSLTSYITNILLKHIEEKQVTSNIYPSNH